MTTNTESTNKAATGYRYLATAVMTAGFGFFGAAKVFGADLVKDGAAWERLSENQWLLIGLLELAAVAALLAALYKPLRALGVAAAAGLATLAACAVVFHLVNSDPAGDIAPAVIQGLVATGYVAVTSKEVRQS